MQIVTQFKITGNFDVWKIQNAGVCDMDGVLKVKETEDWNFGYSVLVITVDSSFKDKIFKAINEAGVRNLQVDDVVVPEGKYTSVSRESKN